ncbi:MAG: hypothetical protein BWY99_01975 [Synergistetes bacterium ADurb.BinA166]|nr:MAG: hypothetical protein BWY99_01975 [Synergistetes bacterium ADurb.BinA166]
MSRSISSSVSWGVRALVGSSRIRKRAPRHRVLTSSTLCCSPIESCHTKASGSTDSPYLSATSPMRARTISRSTLSGDQARLYPRAMFSSTVMFATSMYCWWTIPSPAAKASLGERKTTSEPLISMRPSSGR